MPSRYRLLSSSSSVRGWGGATRTCPRPGLVYKSDVPGPWLVRSINTGVGMCRRHVFELKMGHVVRQAASRRSRHDARNCHRGRRARNMRRSCFWVRPHSGQVSPVVALMSYQHFGQRRRPRERSPMSQRRRKKTPKRARAAAAAYQRRVVRLGSMRVGGVKLMDEESGYPCSIMEKSGRGSAQGRFSRLPGSFRWTGHAQSTV